jgi:hypothetical protein
MEPAWRQELFFCFFPVNVVLDRGEKFGIVATRVPDKGLPLIGRLRHGELYPGHYRLVFLRPIAIVELFSPLRRYIARKP